MHRHIWVVLWMAVVSTWGATALASEAVWETLAQEGVSGGLVVWVDGNAADSWEDVPSGYLVFVLADRPEYVADARERLVDRCLHGRVTVAPSDGQRIPLVDDLASAVVVGGSSDLPGDELVRVLAPGGVLLQRDGDAWTEERKPTSADQDEWTHYLYDASNNAVSADRDVDLPRQLQWVAGPSYTRSHDHLASLSTMVTASGRVFSIVDEGSIAVAVLEPEWRLVARDAHNGVLLWKRPLERWQYHLRGFRSGPTDLQRRLVASGDRLFVTLGILAPVSMLDAASGETMATFPQTRGAEEILLADGVLYAVVGEPAHASVERQSRRGGRLGVTEVRPQHPDYEEVPPQRRIVALDPDSGQTLWQKADEDTLELMSTTLAVVDGRAYFQNANEVVCLGARDGAVRWRAQRPVSRSRPTWSAPTLVVADGVVLSADREFEARSRFEPNGRTVEWYVSSRGGQAPPGEMVAFRAEDGKELWRAPCREGYNAPVDVLVADGLVWSGDLVQARDPGITQARDLATGEVRQQRPDDHEFFVPGMGHHRCYRNKATPNYLLLGRSGIEFIDLESGEAAPHHWTRGTCQYGIMPANGMVYVPPHSCACFVTAKLTGFNCLSPRPTPTLPARMDQRDRLFRGADDGVSAPNAETRDDAKTWPTYRHDAARSGSTPASLGYPLEPGWRTTLGGLLTAPTVAEGLVFVADRERQSLLAVSMTDGQVAWRFEPGGGIDSPPTIERGLAIFGARDGYVYALDAGTGELVWRCRAAPRDLRIVAHERVESLWPVSGSVLVRDGVVYCAAGRSSYLDGGIRLLALEAESGELLRETIIDDRDPETMLQRRGVVQGPNMPGALPDILSSDGASLFMRHRRFSFEGESLAPDVPHLYSAAGFLDDAWWHRTYWQIGTSMAGGYGGWPRTGSAVPAGRLLCRDDERIVGFGRNQYIHHGAHIGIDGRSIYHFKPDRDAQRRFTHYRAFLTETDGAKKKLRWEVPLDLLARAMVLAGDAVVLAGVPDVLSSEDPMAVMEGRRGGRLVVLDAADGTMIYEEDLSAPPVFDGMALVEGQLVLTTVDGAVVCRSVPSR